MLLITVLGSTLVFSPAPVVAQSPQCGATITTDTVLSASIGPCSGNGLVMGAGGITLNCAGYAIKGGGSGVGINLTGMARATVENCKVTGFQSGLLLNGSSSDALVGNTANSNAQQGFMLESSSNDTLSSNTANGNGYFGFYLLFSSDSNALSGNTASNNAHTGFFLVSGPYNNTLAGNTANYNRQDGFVLNGTSDGNTLSGNKAVGDRLGIRLDNSSNNTLTSNNATQDDTGIYLQDADGNELGNNAARSNLYGFYLWDASGNTLAWNRADYNLYYGYTDNTTGSGTAGTANLYSSDECSLNGDGGSTPSGLCLQFILLSPSSGIAGTSVTITGGGFAPSHAVNATYVSWFRCRVEPGGGHCDIIYSTGMPLVLSGDCTTSSTGSLGGCTFTVPYVPDSGPGHSVIVTDGTVSVRAGFRVPPHSISLGPPMGAAGTTVTVTGSGFAASQVLTVTLDGSTAGMPTTCTSDASGNISSGCTLVVPASSALGFHTITAIDSTGNASAWFTVTLLGVTCSKPTVTMGLTTTCRATVRDSGVGAPTGTVTWSSSGSGTFSKTSCKLSRHGTYSTCSVKYTPSAPGSVTLTGNYSGDFNNPATAGAYNLVVTMEATTTTVTCTPRSAVAGSSKMITCKAKVVGHLPTGAVSWSQSGPGSVSLSSTSCTLTSLRNPDQAACSVTMTGETTGKVTLQATYGGDPNNLGSRKTATLTMRAGAAVERGVSYLAASFNDAVGLISNSPDSASLRNTYYLYSDNYLAAVALWNYAPGDSALTVIVRSINGTMTADLSTVKDAANQYEALTTSTCAFSGSKDFLVKTLGQAGILTTVNNQSAKWLSADNYSDIAFLEAACYYRQYTNGNSSALTDAKNAYAAGTSTLKGLCFEDEAFTNPDSASHGECQTYKLALYVYASELLGESYPQSAASLLLRMSAPSRIDKGGFYTCYGTNLKWILACGTNTETTALAILALSPVPAANPPVYEPA
jgi:parallel beta-helix repeat protein